METLEAGLLKILNAQCDNSDFVNNIRYLLNAKILTTLEEDICEKVLKHIEIFHAKNLEKVLNEFDVDITNFENVSSLNYAEMFEEIDRLILTRHEKETKELINVALEESANGNYDEKSLDVFFNRYANEIKIENDTLYEKLEDLDKIVPEETISTTNEYIDSMSGGLPKGSITTIVGTYDQHKSVWALNIAYKCLQENLNVLYISIGTNKLDIYKRFLTRHSIDSKFMKQCNNQEVYNDFEHLLLDKLIIFDETHLCISTQYSLQKLIVYAHNEFLKRHDKGIDVIIIDDFSNMTIDNGKKTITNRGTVVNTYFKYLKHQAKNLLGTNKKIPIITTISASSNSMMSLENNCDFCLDFVDEEVKILSDTILTIYGSTQLRRNDNIRLKVLKSHKEIMEESKLEKADISHWYIIYNSENENTIEKALDKWKNKNQSTTHIMDLLPESEGTTANQDLDFDSNIDYSIDLMTEGLDL